MNTTTAGEVLNRVASEVGLSESPDPYASQDPTFSQLRRLFQSVGQDLLTLRLGPRKEWQITTNGTAAYSMAADCYGILNETGWDKTNQRPLYGPLTPSEWARAQSLGVVSYTPQYRQDLNQVEFYPVPAAGLNFAYLYLSKLWAQSQGATAGDKATPSASTDTVLFDDLLTVRALKLAFLQAKGFDTTTAVAEYRTARDAALARLGARRLSLTPRSGIPSSAVTPSGVVYS